VVPFWRGSELRNAWARAMSANREMMAASGAEDCNHGAEDALACLAEQCAARPRARQYQGPFSGRRRWRFAERLAGQCPRIVEFHDAIPHPYAQNLVPQHSSTRLFALPVLTGKLARGLPARHARAARAIYRKGCGKLPGTVVLRFGFCHPTVNVKRFRVIKYSNLRRVYLSVSVVEN
jgi:hypothetical protein